MADIYTFITEETVAGARDRVLADLNEITNGQAEKAIACVSEFVELNKILEEHKERQRKEAEKAEEIPFA